MESSIIPISQDVIYEHRTYLPGFGFFLVLTGVVFYFLWDRYRRVGLAILVLIALANTVLTYERNKVWASEYTLWADCVKKSPNKPRPLSNYGNALAHAGHASEALTYYDKAIKVNPHFYAAYGNRGLIYVSLGNYNQAIEDCNKAIELDPKNKSAYNNRAWSYFELGRYQLAISDFKENIKLNKNSKQTADSYIGLAISYFELKNIKEAKLYYKQAVEIEPLFKKSMDAALKEKWYFYTTKQKRIGKQVLDLLTVAD